MGSEEPTRRPLRSRIIPLDRPFLEACFGLPQNVQPAAQPGGQANPSGKNRRSGWTDNLMRQNQPLQEGFPAHRTRICGFGRHRTGHPKSGRREACPEWEEGSVEAALRGEAASGIPLRADFEPARFGPAA